MAIEWTQDLATGLDWQDKQHKELFVRVNNLMEAMRAGKGKEEVGKVLSFLGDYVVLHFGEEEKHMEKFKYPGFSSHKSEHTKLVGQFSGLKNKFETQSLASIAVIEVQRFLVDWLKNHIGKVDKELGTFLKTKQ